MTNQNVPVSEHACRDIHVAGGNIRGCVEWRAYHELGHSWRREPEDIRSKVDLRCNRGQLGQVALTDVLELGVPVAIHLLRCMVHPMESKVDISVASSVSTLCATWFVLYVFASSSCARAKRHGHSWVITMMHAKKIMANKSIQRSACRGQLLSRAGQDVAQSAYEWKYAVWPTLFMWTSPRHSHRPPPTLCQAQNQCLPGLPLSHPLHALPSQDAAPVARPAW